MADITKKVNQWVPVNARTQTFTQDDAGTGDVILVKESLGAAAGQVLIEAAAEITVRFNVYHTVFPQRRHNPDFMHTSHMPNLAQGTRVKDDTVATVTVGAGESFEMDGKFPTSDIEIVSAGGDFTILVS